MADLARNIRGIAVEDRASSLTPTMQRFSYLLNRMDRLLTAERTLESDTGPLDRPEFDALLREAEAERAGAKAEAEGFSTSRLRTMQMRRCSGSRFYF